MKTKIILLITTLSLTFLGNSQDNVYGSYLDDGYSPSYKIVKTTASPLTGNAGSFSNVKSNIIATAALGASNDGWLYYLEYGDAATASRKGRVDIWATKADGSGTPKKICENFDVNGSNDADVQFVRLGVTADNWGWILAKKEDGSTLYLSKFKVSGNSNTSPIRMGTATTDDSHNSIFLNGDLCFDAHGNMFALANDGEGKTKIYILDKDQLAGATSTSTVTLKYKWLLKKSNGHNFTGRVNGNAFSSSGSMYISTDDGLYFIDQTTVNTIEKGTVLCSLSKSQSYLTDLATAYWPVRTSLPVKFNGGPVVSEMEIITIQKF